MHERGLYSMKKALLALLCLLPLLCAARAEATQLMDDETQAAELLLYAAHAEAGYKIDVDIENQIVTVYRADDDSEDGIVRQMLCSTGRSSSTPRGTFTLFTREKVDRREWYYISKFRCYVQYPTRIYNDILFHSLPYSAKDLSTLDQTALSQLGQATSHGCIRLYSEDAKWIAENCGDGTVCRIYIGGTRDEELRARLLGSTFTIDGPWESYREFLGWGEDGVSRASETEEILALQTLLQSYGYYDGELDGAYSTQTILAVSAAQEVLGEAPNGLASEALLTAMKAETLAPSTRATLEPGMTGPAVKALQTALNRIGYFPGTVNGEYSDALAQAVRLFRLARDLGDEVNADSQTQTEALAAAEAYSYPDGTKLVLSMTSVPVATLTGAKSLELRSRATSASSALDCYLKRGETVDVLEKGEVWSRILLDGTEGYVKNYYLTFGSRIRYIEQYVEP